MAQGERHSLLDRALELPAARGDDFYGGRRPPSGVDQRHLKIIKDTALRARLIDAGIAEGLQSPKGPQKIASIIRVYPEGDAPPRETGSPRKREARTPREPREPRRLGRPPATVTVAPRGLPTVEGMATLIERLREVEAAVGRELVVQVDARIAGLKKRIASLDGAELERAFAELGSALDERRALSTHARAEAFRRVEIDESFPERVHLRVLARP